MQTSNHVARIFGCRAGRLVAGSALAAMLLFATGAAAAGNVGNGPGGLNGEAAGSVERSAATAIAEARAEVRHAWTTEPAGRYAARVMLARLAGERMQYGVLDPVAANGSGNGVGAGFEPVPAGARALTADRGGDTGDVVQRRRLSPRLEVISMQAGDGSRMDMVILTGPATSILSVLGFGS